MTNRLLKDLISKIRHLYISKLTIKQKFDYFYRNNIFEGQESISGEGSSISQTRIIAAKLQKLCKELKIKSIVDAPCGDLNWIKHLDLGKVKYYGVDVVQTLIDKNMSELSTKSRTFICADLINYVPPKVDLILCRDCLVHLTFEDAKKVILNFKKSGSKYLLTTTFPQRKSNLDLGSTIWRTLNLQKLPFRFPKPKKILNEGCTEMNNQYTDKSLGLWKISDIKI